MNKSTTAKKQSKDSIERQIAFCNAEISERSKLIKVYRRAYNLALQSLKNEILGAKSGFYFDME